MGEAELDVDAELFDADDAEEVEEAEELIGSDDAAFDTDDEESLETEEDSELLTEEDSEEALTGSGTFIVASGAISCQTTVFIYSGGTIRLVPPMAESNINDLGSLPLATISGCANHREP